MVPFFFVISMSCRYTEKEKTAERTPAVTGPAAPPSAQRGLSNGTDETLRQCSALCLGSSQCLQWEHITPKSYLYHLLQKSKNLELDRFHWTKPEGFFWGGANKLIQHL